MKENKDMILYKKARDFLTNLIDQFKLEQEQYLSDYSWTVTSFPSPHSFMLMQQQDALEQDVLEQALQQAGKTIQKRDVILNNSTNICLNQSTCQAIPKCGSCVIQQKINKEDPTCYM